MNWYIASESCFVYYVRMINREVRCFDKEGKEGKSQSVDLDNF